MISQKLLSVVLGFEIIPVNGKELREKSFGYEQGLRTACISPLKDNEWISLSDSTIHFGYKDMRPEVLINIPKGVCTIKKINIYELAYKCKEWALNNGYFSIAMFRADELFSCDIGPTSSDNWDQWSECFIEETEHEAIFKACQFILDEQEYQKRVLND